MAPEVYNHFKRPPKVLKDWTKEKSMTEKSGYVPQNVRVENLILAGQRLAKARDELYDTIKEVDIDEVPLDPTRLPGYDMADASQSLYALQQRANEAKIAKKAAEALKIDSKAPGEAQEPKKEEGSDA